MPWFLLFIAGLFEVGWAIGIGYTEGFTRPLPTIATLVALVVSFLLLALALRTIPVGTGYAVWTGIGVVGTTLLGILLFDEPRDLFRIGCILLILIGVVGLRISEGQPL